MAGIYKIAREQANLTRDRAAEYLYIASDTLASYEQGRRIPPDDVVVRMSELYSFNLLSYQHLKLKATASELPNVEQVSLSQAVIMLVKGLNEVKSNIDTLLNIACENRVLEEDEENWEKIKENIDNLQKACLTIKYCDTEGGEK